MPQTTHPTIQEQVEECTRALWQARTHTSIEAIYLNGRYIRKLYKLLPAPTYELCGDPQHNHYSRISRYTCDFVDAETNEHAKFYNMKATEFGRLLSVSLAKARIIDDYARAGWHVAVSNYIVTAQKYVPHPVYPQLFILFTVTRDNATYKYVLNKDYFNEHK